MTITEKAKILKLTRAALYLWQSKGCDIHNKSIAELKKWRKNYCAPGRKHDSLNKEHIKKLKEYDLDLNCDDIPMHKLSKILGVSYSLIHYWGKTGKIEIYFSGHGIRKVSHYSLVEFVKKFQYVQE